MKKMTFFTVLVLTSLLKTYSSEYLIMNHVMNWGWQETGYIQSASLLVEPKGLYAECTMILDFSTGGNYYDEFDSLEIEMNFNLPDESQIRQLYLWINDEPVKGVMYDKWTASLIYESIVERRIDPAILTKTGANEYNIKIFPLLSDLPRRIEIQFITPISNLLSKNPLVSTPFNILKLSADLPDAFKLAFIGGTSFIEPQLLEADEVSFTAVDDPDFGICELATITNLSQYSSLSLKFNEVSESQIQMRTFNDESSGSKYYELAFKHSAIFDIEKNRKAVFLIDYIDENCAAYTKQDILDRLEDALGSTFTEVDSFNILFSGMITSFLSTGWIGADSASIANAFDNIDLDVMHSYSNLPTLLVDGIDFLMNKGSIGSLVLIASSNSNGGGSEANALINDYLESLEGTEIPIHIIDLDDKYYSSNEMNYIGGQYFSGNEYLYTRLSQLTVGEYYSIRQYSYFSMLGKVNHRLSGYFKSLEVFIQSEGGYAFSNFTLQGAERLTYNDEAFCLVGQYVGEPPFYVSVFGQDSEFAVHHAIDTIAPQDLLIGDTLVKKVWASQMIMDLYKMEQSTQVVNQIINTSIEEYLLTSYTALLVLEPGFQIPDDLLEDEDDVPIPTELEVSYGSQGYEMNIFPNPCKENTTISYIVPQRGNIRIVIFNSLGQYVNTLVDEVVDGGEYTLSFDTSALETGIYYCSMMLDGATMAKVRIAVL